MGADPELKLLMTYHDELAQLLDPGQSIAILRSSKESAQRYQKQAQQKLDIFEKQVLKCKSLFTSGDELQYVQYNESQIYYFKGLLKMFLGTYHEMYPGVFASSKFSEVSGAITLFDKALQIYEDPLIRFMKVSCYRMLKDKQNALRELDYILEHYAQDENVYLMARKDKDELETPTSGISQFFRSIFG